MAVLVDRLKRTRRVRRHYRRLALLVRLAEIDRGRLFASRRLPPKPAVEDSILDRPDSLVAYCGRLHLRCKRIDLCGRLRAVRANRARLTREYDESQAPAEARGMSHNQAVRAWDRLRSKGIIPAPRSLPSAKPLPDVALPGWLAGLTPEDMSLAWLSSVEFPTADSSAWVARGRSLARQERGGRYAGEDERTHRIERREVAAFDAIESETVRDWLARDRDTVDDQAVARERLSILRDELGTKLADLLAQGHTQAVAAAMCGTSERSIRRAVAVARRKVASVS